MLYITVLIVLFFVSIYFSIYKMFYDKKSSFITMLHISGVVSLLFCMINQLHVLCEELEYLSVVLGSVCVYTETMALCYVLAKRRICKE